MDLLMSFLMKNGYPDRKDKLGRILSLKLCTTYQTLAKNSQVMLLRLVFPLFLQYTLNHTSQLLSSWALEQCV